MNGSRTIRIGAGAAYAGDRIEPAVELCEKGNLDYLVFECLAERTIALAQLAKLKDPLQGYDTLLDKRISAVLSLCLSKGIRIISNMGAANPVAAAEKIVEIASSHGSGPVKVAAVLGDDVLAHFQSGSVALPEPVNLESLVSANAYIGADALLEALKSDANVIVAGRVADPSLFLAPMIHEFGWSLDDWNMLGQGTMIGHLLECAGQITGGYFADPGYKDVQDLARLGFPVAEVQSDGSARLTKVEGSGGRITLATCREQLLYELHDPSAYVTPDVIADFSDAEFVEIAPNLIAVGGGRGKQRPEKLKVSVGYRDGYRGEGQITYAGSSAVARGQLALEIVRERLGLTGVPIREIRSELIGLNSVATSPVGSGNCSPPEVRARVAGRTWSLESAQAIADEVETLYTNGPAGGGGVTKDVREVIAIEPAYLDRAAVSSTVRFVEKAKNEY